jgi:hypothetical protein
MTEASRTSPREICFIRAFANGHTGQVRDITDDGMKITLFGNLPLSTGESINVKIVPDESLKIPSFYIRGTVRWITNDKITVNFGFSFTRRGNLSVSTSLEKILRTWK